MIPTPTCAGLDGGSHVQAKARAALAWPTPTIHGNNNFKGASATSGDGLMTVIKRREGYPTPNARDAKPGTARPHGGGQKGQAPQTNLNDLVLRWPTPCAADFKGPGKMPRDRLDYAVNGQTKSATYPTPQTDHMGGGEMARKRLRKLEADGVLSAEETRGLMMRTTGKQLNPDWEEWLMFWPVGWTDLETPNIRLVWLDPSIDPADYGEIPRITNRRDNRPARVKEIGNGQYPLTAAVAFHWGLWVLQLVNKGEK